MTRLCLLAPQCHTDGGTGGITLSILEFQNLLKCKNVVFDVLDTNISNYTRNPSTIPYSILRGITSLFRCSHISLHGTANDFKFLLPIITFFCFITRKSYSYRKFAGNFDVVYNSLPPIWRSLLYLSLRCADFGYFETRYLVAYFRSIGIACNFYPNSRIRSVPYLPPPHNKRGIYLGHISTEKGLHFLCQTLSSTYPELSIDCFGNVKDPALLDLINATPGIHYRGYINPSQSQKVIQAYDFLILPSFREGYPGVIIESLAAGRLVVASKLPSIVEMIADQESGFLFKTGCSKSLSRALKKLAVQPSIIDDMSLNAFKSFSRFDSEEHISNFLSHLRP